MATIGPKVSTNPAVGLWYCSFTYEDGESWDTVPDERKEEYLRKASEALSGTLAENLESMQPGDTPLTVTVTLDKALHDRYSGNDYANYKAEVDEVDPDKSQEYAEGTTYTLFLKSDDPFPMSGNLRGALFTNPEGVYRLEVVDMYGIAFVGDIAYSGALYVKVTPLLPIKPDAIDAETDEGADELAVIEQGVDA